VRYFLIILTLLFFTFRFSEAGENTDTPTTGKIFRKPVQLSVKGNSYYKETTGIIDVYVKLTDTLGNPLDGITFYVKCDDNKVNFKKKVFITDSTGYSIVSFENPKKGVYTLLFYTDHVDIRSDPVPFKVNVYGNFWVVFMIIGLIGGLSLFLFGMSQMSVGLQNSAGTQMRMILNKLSNNRFVAVGVGAIITSVIQSSSATNVMLVSFVNSHLMKFRQTIGIILGAAIGTTITAQIIAFKLTDFALVFVSLGLGIHSFTKKNKHKEIGRSVLGFGILFFGMHIMSESMYPLRTFQPFIDLIVTLEKPLLGILAGVLFTALIQSSSAFIGILIILSMQGLLSMDAAISLIIGANIGTAITAILASINTTREAQQVAFAHTLIKIIGATIFIIIIVFFTPLVEKLNLVTQDMASPRQIANIHTIYNIILCAVFLPFTNKVAWLVNKMFPIKEQFIEKLSLKFIDKNLIQAPAFALNAARIEVLRLMKDVEEMLELIIKPFFDRENEVITKIDELEEEVNFLRDQINDFLITLSQSNIGEDEIEEAFILMNVVREFEQIADIVSTQLKNKAQSWCENKYEFSKIGKEELEHYHQRTLGIIKKAEKVYKSFDLKKAQKLKKRYYSYRSEYFDLERQHYERLKENIEETISSSKTHLEIITLFKVIGSHATNTARILLRNTSNELNDTDKPSD
jgi:phosphate:Na+ symporter